MSLRKCFWMVAVVSLGLCGVQGAAWAQATETKPETKPAENAVEKIELKHCTPTQLQNLAAALAELRKTGGAPPTTLRVAASPDTTFVIVRGTVDEIKQLQEVVKALDVPAEELKVAKLGGVTFAPVPGKSAEAAERLFAQLGIETPGTLIIGKTTIFLLPDNKETESLLKVLESVKAEKPKVAEKPAAEGR